MIELFFNLANLQRDLGYIKYFKEIKRLKSLQKAQACLKLKRASAMEAFCEIYLTAY